MQTNLPPSVAAMMEIDLTGNVIPHNWYHHIRYPNGKVCANAILILAEIIYWYRPKEIVNEATGQLMGFSKRFKADKLQRDYQAIANKMGLTKRQAVEACHLLKDLGLITLELRTIQTQQGRKTPNVLFIDIVPVAIRGITNYCPVAPDSPHKDFPADPLEEVEDVSRYNVTPQTKAVHPSLQRERVPRYNATPPPPKRDTLPHSNGIHPALEVDTNTEITTETSTEISTETLNPILSREARDAIDFPAVKTEVVSDLEIANLSVPVGVGQNSLSIASRIGQDSTFRSAAVPVEKRKTRRKVKSAPTQFPEQFDSWWEVYREFCLRVDCEAGKRTEAIAAWDTLLQAEPECLQAVFDGSEYYVTNKARQFVDKGQAIGVSHGCRFLRDRKWHEALERKQRVSDFAPIAGAGDQKSRNIRRTMSVAVELIRQQQQEALK